MGIGDLAKPFKSVIDWGGDILTDIGKHVIPSEVRDVWDKVVPNEIQDILPTAIPTATAAYFGMPALFGAGGIDLADFPLSLDEFGGGIDLADFPLSLDEFGGGAGWLLTGALDLSGAGSVIPSAVAGGGLGWKSLAGLAGLTLGSQYLGAKSQEKSIEEMYNQQRQNQEQAMRLWQQTAYPSADRAKAMKSTGVEQIAKQTATARKSLADQMAARGMGGSSGLYGHELADIERERMSNMSDLARQLAQFQNTPQFAPPIYQGQVYPQTGFGERVANIGSNVAGTASALALYNWLKGLQ